MKTNNLITLVLGLTALGASTQAAASCADVSRAAVLSEAKKIATGLGPTGNRPNGGFDLPVWVSMVDEFGRVCFVLNTGDSQAASIGNTSWLGSRLISAQKANTANAFSLDNFAISSGILYKTAHENNSLFGIQHSNPVNSAIAYKGVRRFGIENETLVGKPIGGINVFGGGLALYNAAKKKIGAIGVSGDTSCTDHVVAWKLRAALKLDNLPGGFITSNFKADGTPLVIKSGAKGDEIIVDVDGTPASADAQAWDHAACPNTPTAKQSAGAIIEN